MTLTEAIEEFGKTLSVFTRASEKEREIAVAATTWNALARQAEYMARRSNNVDLTARKLAAIADFARRQAAADDAAAKVVQLGGTGSSPVTAAHWAAAKKALAAGEVPFGELVPHDVETIFGSQKRSDPQDVKDATIARTIETAKRRLASKVGALS